LALRKWATRRAGSSPDADLFLPCHDSESIAALMSELKAGRFFFWWD
jgi:hypothetical protein